MSKFGVSDPLEMADKTADIIEQVHNDYLASGAVTPDEIRDCYNELGGAQGYDAGYAYVDNNLNGVVTPEPAQPTIYDVAPLCEGIVVPDNGFFIPSFTNPFLAAVEVALTPTELAPGTVFTDGADQVYSDAYQGGLQTGSVDAFDANLNDRFQPSIEPTPIVPEPALTTPEAALDYTPPSYSDHNSGSSDFSSAPSAGDSDGGSSGGGSSSD